MVKTVKRRLEELAWDISSIGNFIYAPEYGHTEEKIERLAERAKKEFLGQYNITKTTYPIVELILQPNLEGITKENLGRFEKEVGGILKELKGDEQYTKLRDAYEKDDQEKVADALPQVFVDFRTQSIIGPHETPQRLFHGVTVPNGFTPDQYLAFCLKIKEEGLIPSQFGQHHSMDRDVRPIYSTPSPLESHGLIGLTFIPKNYAVVIENNQEEAMIYTPRLKADFELTLRHSDTFTSYRPHDYPGVPDEQIKDYVKSLESGLKKKGIPFHKLNLDSRHIR